MESLTELAAEEVPSKKLFIFTEALKKAASMTIPLRVLRTNETPYMNDEIKCLMKKRNQLRRNLALNGTAWLQKSKEVAEKVEEAKRMSWRNHHEKIKAGKDARLAWRTVRGLKNNRQQPTGKALQYKSQMYLTVASKLYGVNATVIIFVFVLYCIVLYCIVLYCTTVIRPKQTLLYKSMPTLVAGLATE